MATGPKSILNITGMSGQPDVAKVRSALHGVTGVVTESVEIGTATIRADKPDQCRAACAAVSAIGFEAKEAADAGGKGATPTSPGAAAGARPATQPKSAANGPQPAGDKPRK